ncbi:MAG: hypothetical protein ABMB14_30700 [Myxococcota bacterium]
MKTRSIVWTTLVWTTVALAACGVSEGKFQDQYVAKSCEALESCADASGTGVSISFGSQSECETFLGPFVSLATAGCDFDPAAASDCLADLDEPDCDAVNSGGAAASSCEAVYSGDGCGWATDGSSSSSSTSG